MRCKKSLKFNFIFLFSYLILLLTLTSEIYAQEEEEQKLTYRRNDNTFLENYNQLDKAKYFPLKGTGVWTELNPNVPRTDYIGVDFINPDTGWACGLWGAVIRTINSGQEWTTIETPTGEILLKVHSYNGQVVIIVGHNGTILRSADGGQNFTLLTGITTEELWGVKMLNDTLGWICGRNQTLLKTTNAGITWQAVITGFNYHYWSCDFLDKNNFMIACSQGRVLKTNNGGQSFTQHQAGSTQDLYTIDIIDSLHIAAAGNFGKNVYSSDGGVSWVENQYTSLSLNWIQYINKDTGFVILESAGLYKTTNRGQSWFNPGFDAAGEWQFELLDDSLGYGVGAGLTVTKTEDGFNTGENLFLNKNWSDVFFVNETKGYLISADLGAGIYKTEDGGVSYQKIVNAPSGYDLFFSDILTGFIAGTHKTTDGGENWYSVNGGGTKVFFINDSIGWSIGGSNIYKTIDGGENWFEQSNSGWSFTSIYFVNSMYGWTSQVGGRPFKTTDGGLNWIEQTNLNIWDSRDLYFVDSLNGFIIDGLLELLRTTDSGTNWFTKLNSQYIIRSFGWLDNQRGFIIGDGMYETTDSGETWQEILEIRNVGLRKFHAPQNYLGYSVGNQGLIYKYIDSSYIPIELISFTGLYYSEKIILNWETASEINNLGFEIQKSKNRKNWLPIGFVSGSGTTTELNSYNFIDNNTSSEKNYYRLKQIDYVGSFSYSKIIEITVPVNDFALSQNFPNPSNPSTTIAFSIPTKAKVKIELYSICGEFVRRLIDDEKDKGIYNLNIDLSNLASGVYLYRMSTNNGYSNVKKLILLK